MEQFIRGYNKQDNKYMKIRIGPESLNAFGYPKDIITELRTNKKYQVTLHKSCKKERYYWFKPIN